jgi:hypothetical protein
MDEHYIKVAERFGLSHKEPETTRRDFLRGLLATGALVAAPSGLFVPVEPKIHQVAGVVAVPEFVNGSAHIRFPDGREISLRDFEEKDKFDTVHIRESLNPHAPWSQVPSGVPAAGLVMLATYQLLTAVMGGGLKTDGG